MRRALSAVFGTIAGLVLLLSFKTQSSSPLAISRPTTVTPSTSGGSSSTSTGTPRANTPSASTSTGSSSAAATKTVTGDAATTHYGPVQVKITVSNGKITSVEAVDYPNNDPRDSQINSFAIPQLNSEALAASSAQIDTVSGATYTSNGYVTSLQSALDKAGL